MNASPIIRSNSLIWATITAYSLLIVCTMLIYDMQYLNFGIYRLVHDIVSVHHKVQHWNFINFKEEQQ